MRRTLPLTLVAAALLAAPAVAAPRGVTYADAAGDANGLDGRAPAGSQAAFDVLRVQLSPYDRNARTSGLAIRVDLAAAPSTSPGSSYYFAAKQDGCDITVSRTASTDGVATSTLVTCGAAGEYHSSSVSRGFAASGRSVTFTIPSEALPNARLGALLSAVEVGTATGEPATGFASPARVDRAAYGKAYRIGS